MRVLIATDLEGISGVCVWEQARDMTSAAYQEARRLLMGDVNAAVTGCVEAGAGEVVVCDGHGGGFNCVPERIHPASVWLTGRERPPFSKREELYKGFDAALLVGYHAMAGTADGMLAHTQSSKAGNRYWYNGAESGEIFQSSLVFGHFNIPVVMVTGDRAACREAEALLPNCVGVEVKVGYSTQYGTLMAPTVAHERIRTGAAAALAARARCRPLRVGLPIHGKLCFPDKSTADGFRPRRATRTDDYTFEADFERALDIYEF